MSTFFVCIYNTIYLYTYTYIYIITCFSQLPAAWCDNCDGMLLAWLLRAVALALLPIPLSADVIFRVPEVIVSSVKICIVRNLNLRHLL